MCNGSGNDITVLHDTNFRTETENKFKYFLSAAKQKTTSTSMRYWLPMKQKPLSIN